MMNNGIKKRETCWERDQCKLCRETASTPDEKASHERNKKHLKKQSVKDFYDNDMNMHTAEKIAESAILNRYQCLDGSPFGLEAINELKVSWTNHLWVCSLCFESGFSIAQLDAHILSRSHMENFLQDFYVTELESLRKASSSRVIKYEDLLTMWLDLAEKSKGEALPPEVIQMNDCSRETAFARLVIGEDITQHYKVFKPDPTDNKKMILRCLTCTGMVASSTKREKSRVCSTHEGSKQHRACAYVKNILDQYELSACEDMSIEVDPNPVFDWMIVSGDYHGPVCGLSHLVKAGSEYICSLCFSEVKNTKEHFSSEEHIAKFLSLTHGVEMFRLKQLNNEARRKGIMDLLKKADLNNGTGRMVVGLSAVPHVLKAGLASISHRQLESGMPELNMYDGVSNCLYCRSCSLVLKVGPDVTDGGLSVWDDHCSSPYHFDCMARSAQFSFDPEGFVPKVSSIKRMPIDLRGKWETVERDNDVSIRVQTQCDIGLEFMVEDEDNDEVVCTLCWRNYKRNNNECINQHMRSLVHTMQYLHACERGLVSLIELSKSDQETQSLIIDFLQRQRLDETSEMKVYNMRLAKEIAKMGTVSLSQVNSVKNYEPTVFGPVEETVQALVNEVSRDGAEKACCDFRVALIECDVKLVKIKNDDLPKAKASPEKSTLIFKCMGCRMAFSSSMKQCVQNVFVEHLKSIEHYNKKRTYETVVLRMNGFTDNKSTYTVRPISQPDPAKRIAWKFNSATQQHEYLLTICGLDELVERRSNDSEEHPTDFFCRLCAEVIPRRQQLIEDHIRSGSHLYCFMHKDDPSRIFDIDALPQNDVGRRKMRGYMANYLKEIPYKGDYCIPIYDPFGERERKALLVTQKKQEEERKREFIEARKKAQEERMKKEEERRQLREKEMIKEKQRREERHRIERENQERYELIEQQKTAQKLKDLEKEKEQQEARRLERIAKTTRDLQAQLDQKKKEKEKKEKEKREKLTNEASHIAGKLQNLRAAKANEPAIYVPDPQLVIPAKLVAQGDYGRQQAPSTNMMNIPPPPIGRPMGGMNPFGNYGNGLYSSTPPFNPPPPHPNQYPPHGSFPPYHHQHQHKDVTMGLDRRHATPDPVQQTLSMVGPKPSFSTFVPVVESIPVYPTKDTNDDGERSDVSDNYARDRDYRARSRSRGREASPRREGRSPAGRQMSNFRGRAQKRPSLFRKGVRDDMKAVKTIDEMKELALRCGAEPCPIDEMPEAFNKKLSKLSSLVGLGRVYEMICIDDPSRDTFYCSLCARWMTPPEMYKHVTTIDHKMSYLFADQRSTFNMIKQEESASIRLSMIQGMALETWKLLPELVTNRMRALMDRSVVDRLAAQSDPPMIFDDNWLYNDDDEYRIEIAPPVPREAVSFMDPAPVPTPEKSKEPTEPSKARKSSKEKHRAPSVEVVTSSSSRDKKRDDKVSSRSKIDDKKETKDSKEEKKRHASPQTDRKRRRSKSRERRDSRNRRSRSRDVTTKSSTSKRKSSRSPPHRDSRHSRRTRSRSRSRTRTPPSRPRESKSFEDAWEDQTAKFLNKIGGATLAGIPGNSNYMRDDEVASRIKQLQNLFKPAMPLTPSIPPASTAPVTEDSDADVVIIEDEPKRKYQRHASPTHRSPAASHPPPVDSQAELRKLLGLLINIQADAQNGPLSQERLSQICQEHGLPSVDCLTENYDKLMAMLSEQFQLGQGESLIATAASTSATKPVIDLSVFGILQNSSASAHSVPPPISAKAAVAPHQHNMTYPGDQRHQQQRQTPQSYHNAPPQQQQWQQPGQYQQQQQQPSRPPIPDINSLLAGIKPSMATIRAQEPLAPLTKPNPYHITSRDDFFPESSQFSYVYPDLDSREDEEKRRENQQAAVQPQHGRQNDGKQQKQDASPWAQSQQQHQQQNKQPPVKEPEVIDLEDDVPEPPRARTPRARTPQQSSSAAELSKEEKKAMRERLLAEAERMRKEAIALAADEEYDEWDTLETEMSSIMTNKPSGSQKQQEPSPQQQQQQGKIKRPPANYGMPSSWQQPIPQPQKPTEVRQPEVAKQQQQSVQKNATAGFPLVPGQKMALPRTILPNGITIPEEPKQKRSSVGMYTGNPADWPQPASQAAVSKATQGSATTASSTVSSPILPPKTTTASQQAYQYAPTTQQTSTTAAAASYYNPPVQPAVQQPTAAQYYAQQYNNAPAYPNQYPVTGVSAYQQQQQAAYAQHANPAAYPGYQYSQAQQPPPPGVASAYPAAHQPPPPGVAPAYPAAQQQQYYGGQYYENGGY